MGKLKDLTNREFDRLTVIERAEDYVSPKGKHCVQWLCSCECGNEKIIRGDSLMTGGSQSCGCFNSEVATRTGKLRRRDLTDRIFERLTVIKESEIQNSIKGTVWDCKCSCGNTCKVNGRNLLHWDVKSCGCLSVDLARARKGDKSPGWKGGITPLHTRIQQSTMYNNWRTAVFEKYDFVCQFSGERSAPDLQVHHIKSFSQILRENNISTMEEALACEELWDVENGIVIREKYHIGIKTYNLNAFHRIYGNHIFTSQDFKVWLLAITPEFAEELRCS